MASAAQGSAFRLGVDFGTSHTTAVLRWPDGHSRPLLFDGSPLLPSAVYVQPDGQIVVGRDAVHAARLDPARFVPTPKRLGDQETVRLGESEVGVTAMIAAVLERVRMEAVRVSAATIDDVTLTYPAGWDAARVARLAQAARRAGLPEPSLMPEPVAAAAYFVSVLDRTIPVNSALVVYDFGGGTFDASVVAPTSDGYRVLGVRGLDNVGGVDLDAALLEHIAREQRATNPDVWRQLEDPQTPADRRHRRHLVEDVRAAKEMLSRAETATVPVPLLEQEVRVTRDEFETLARPLLERTLNATTDVIRTSHLPKERVIAVLLVGGSSRVPLVARLLRDQAGLAPSIMDQPETVVAEGSVRLATGASGLTRAGSAIPVPAQPMAPTPGPMSQPVDPWEAEQQTPVLPVPAMPQPTATQRHPTRVHTVPTVPVPPPPPPRYPADPRYPVPAPPYQGPGRPYRPRRRRRWIPVLLVIAILAAAGSAVALFRPDLIQQVLAGGGRTPPPGRTSAPPEPYVREAQPSWLPAGMELFVDDKAEPSVVPGDATNGGECTYERPGVLLVRRDVYDVTGCRATQAVRDRPIWDGAIEAQFAVDRGCGGMWIRTGTKGYFVAVCADGTVQLHRLLNRAPDEGDSERLDSWDGHDTSNIVVGALAVGTQLTVYANGVALGTVTHSEIGSGRVGVGGFAPHPADRMSATVTEFRAWWTRVDEPAPTAQAA